MVVIALSHFCEQALRDEFSAAAQQRIGKAKGFDFLHQRKHISIAHDGFFNIGHWQSETRTLHQPAQFANPYHRRHTGAHPTCYFKLGMEPTFTQFMQSVACKKCNSQKSIGFETATQLGQMPRYIIDAMQIEEADDAVVSLVREIEAIVKTWMNLRNSVKFS